MNALRSCALLSDRIGNGLILVLALIIGVTIGIRSRLVIRVRFYRLRGQRGAILLEFYRRGSRVIERGAPLIRVTELPCRIALMRTKSQVRNDDAAAQAALKQKVMEEFAPLEAEYQ